MTFVVDTFVLIFHNWEPFISEQSGLTKLYECDVEYSPRCTERFHSGQRSGEENILNGVKGLGVVAILIIQIILLILFT